MALKEMKDKVISQSPPTVISSKPVDTIPEMQPMGKYQGLPPFASASVRDKLPWVCTSYRFLGHTTTFPNRNAREGSAT